MEDRKYRKRAKRDIARLNGLWLCAPPTLNTEAVKNYPGGVGSIECVKVNAGNVVIQKIVALFQGEVNADAADHFAIVVAALQSTQKFGRETGAAGEFGDAFEAAH